MAYTETPSPHKHLGCKLYLTQWVFRKQQQAESCESQEKYPLEPGFKRPNVFYLEED